MPLTEFRERMASFVGDLKGNPLADGYREILLPGERAHRTQVQSLQNGVILETDVMADFRAWAQRLSVAFPF